MCIPRNEISCYRIQRAQFALPEQAQASARNVYGVLCVFTDPVHRRRPVQLRTDIADRHLSSASGIKLLTMSAPTSSVGNSGQVAAPSLSSPGNTSSTPVAAPPAKSQSTVAKPRAVNVFSNDGSFLERLQRSKKASTLVDARLASHLAFVPRKRKRGKSKTKCWQGKIRHTIHFCKPNRMSSRCLGSVHLTIDL